MSILVPIPSEADKALALALEFTIVSLRTVDEIADDLLGKGQSAIDAEALQVYSVRSLVDMLGALDLIVSKSWDVELLPANEPHTRLLGLTVERANTLALAIRQAVQAL